MMASIIDKFRAWNRRRIAHYRLGRAPRATPFGFVMNGADRVVSGEFEPLEIALLQTLLARSDRFINVGANTGFYCLLACKMGVPVVALEPVPQTATILLQNLVANGFERGTTVLPVAAGDVASAMRIYGVGTGASLLKGWANNPESLSQLISVVRLDDVVASPAVNEQLLVLMDVEGFEHFALLGATNLLNARPSPIWMIEIAPSGAGQAVSAQTQQTFDLMARHGYISRSVTPGLPLTAGPIAGVANYLFHVPSFEVSTSVS